MSDGYRAVRRLDFGFGPGRFDRGSASRSALYAAIRASTTALGTVSRRSVRARKAWYSLDGLAIARVYFLQSTRKSPVTIDALFDVTDHRIGSQSLSTGHRQRIGSFVLVREP